MKVVVLSTLSSESLKLSIIHQRPIHRDETNIGIRNKVIEGISKKLRINNTQEITFFFFFRSHNFEIPVVFIG